MAIVKLNFLTDSLPLYSLKIPIGASSKNHLPNPPCPSLLNTAGHSASYFRDSNPREHFDFRSIFLCFQIANLKNRVKSKMLCLQSLSFLLPSRAANRSEKRYGDDNARRLKRAILVSCVFYDWLPTSVRQAETLTRD